MEKPIFANFANGSPQIKSFDLSKPDLILIGKYTVGLY